MRAMTRVKAAVAASLAMGLALTAAPAFAADAPVISVLNTTFSSGSWGAGVEFTVTGVPADAESVELSISADYAQGRGTIGSMPGVKEGETTYTGTLIPEESPVMPDGRGFPAYVAYASYTVAGEFFHTDGVPLTVTEGMSVTGPETATVAALAAGIELQFAGFGPDELLDGAILAWNADLGDWESIGDFTATMGPDGSGAGTLTVTGASVGDRFSVLAYGEAGEVRYFVEAVADATVPVTPTPTTPAKPVRVETGV